MLFIREYNAKSLDRSSVSMIDKYNVRLDIVGRLLDSLSSLINDLLALIRDIRNTLGQSKQRIYDNLDQVKEVIEGNGITGTESTIEAIERALAAGDKAMDEAEAALENVERAIECSEDYCDDVVVDVECGETETPSDEGKGEGCDVCSFSQSYPGGSWSCEVCDLDDCTVDLRCGESDVNYTGSGECQLSYYIDDNGETLVVNGACNETSCSHSGNFNIPDDCTFSCSHSTPCQQSEMPDNCTYTCTDGQGCAYGGDDCSYSTTCGQAEACNQFDCNQYDCGEPCGETCHMTNDDGGEGGGEGGGGSCGEDDDGPCNQFDCSEYDCGEPCGETCGL